MKRVYSPLINQYLQYFPCVALIGPRQCGKTTLLKGLPDGWKHFDLEKASDQQIISRDPDLFFRLNPRLVAIDEAQILPALFPALRVAIDDHRSEKGRFVITGSSSPQLLSSVSESLAGRIGIIEMAPFSCSEAFETLENSFVTGLLSGLSIQDFQNTLKPKRSLKQIHDFWWRGGYPEPWLSNDAQFQERWMSQYIRNYIERDIARLFPGLNQTRFQTFVQLLAGSSGTIINYSDVARTLGVSAPTARDYFDIAHGSFLWRNIPAYEKNAMKRVVKHPRGYLRDSGVLHHLLKIANADALLSHPKMGASWEGVVVEEILRGFSALGEDVTYSYYRTGAGAEVDLILEGKFGLVPIEVKYGQNVPAKELRSISDFVQERGCAFGIVINNDEHPRLYSEKILGVPFSHL